MAPPQELLRGQLNAFSDAWRKPHAQAMECWELKEILRMSLALYDAMAALNHHWSDQVHSGSVPFSRERALEVQQLYRDWVVPSGDILKDLKALEKAGFAFEEAARFRAACKDARLTATTDLDAILAAERELEEGRGIPIEEVRDELRRRRLAARQ
jgi:hypothetical protein